jgi:hypothetical protein
MRRRNRPRRLKRRGSNQGVQDGNRERRFNVIIWLRYGQLATMLIIAALIARHQDILQLLCMLSSNFSHLVGADS